MMTDVGGVPVVTTGGNGYGDGCGGSWWPMILIIALLGGGGLWGNRGADVVGQESVRDAIDVATIEGSIQRLDGQMQAGFQNVNDLAQLRDNYKETCETNMNVIGNRYELGSKIDQAAFENAIIAKNAEIANLQCCCETNRNIDSVKYENARLNCESTNAILGAIANDKYERLQEKYEDMRLAYSQCRQNGDLINALRPCPTPAYPAWSPYQQVPPAAYAAQGAGFGNGCCCG